MPTIKAYTAGPYGFSEAGRYFYTQRYLPALRKIGLEILDPWAMADEARIKRIQAMPFGIEQQQAWQRFNQITGRMNAIAIQKAGLVIAVLDGVDVDSGTAAEIGYAAGLGKPVFGYRGDFRLSADNIGSTVNLQVEYFIRMHGGKIATTLDELLDSLVAYLHPKD